MKGFSFRTVKKKNNSLENTYITIGGIEQYLQIRGEDRNNPVILWLHGGPGFPLTYLAYYYQTALEKDYTMFVGNKEAVGEHFTGTKTTVI